jgi:hypothetical protein
MAFIAYVANALSEPLASEPSAPRPEWRAHRVAIAAASAGVAIVASIAVLMGMA